MKLRNTCRTTLSSNCTLSVDCSSRLVCEGFRSRPPRCSVDATFVRLLQPQLPAQGVLRTAQPTWKLLRRPLLPQVVLRSRWSAATRPAAR